MCFNALQAFRSCRDNLEKLVTRPRDPTKKGSARDQRVAIAAHFWSMCGARAAPIYDDDSYCHDDDGGGGEGGNCKGEKREKAAFQMAIVPVFDILAHDDAPNIRLEMAGAAAAAGAAGPAAIHLVAATAVAAGTALTRNYGLSAPCLQSGAPAPAPASSSASEARWHHREEEDQGERRRLRLLLWAGIKPQNSR